MLLDLYIKISNYELIFIVISSLCYLLLGVERSVKEIIKRKSADPHKYFTIGKYCIFISFPVQFILFLTYVIHFGKLRIVGILSGIFFYITFILYKKITLQYFSHLIFITILIRFLADLL